jgi:predicted nucleotidyltransferase
MDIQSLIADIADRLVRVRGVEAVVLGGSRARGSHRPDSDIDIGIYYGSPEALDLDALQKIATELDDDHRENLLTAPRGWGPWINGGGWLKVRGMAVDILYRDLSRVRTVIDECLHGQVTIDMQPGHPHGFTNAIYLAEIALCRILHDPSGTVAQLKSEVTPYPSSLKRALIDRFLWEADFSVQTGRKSISGLDTSYAAGSCFRAVSCLNQVLFAFNECHFMNEKGAVSLATSLKSVPAGYRKRVDEIFSLISPDQERLKEAFEQLEKLVRETEDLVSG